MKTIYQCKVTAHSGRVFENNPIKLSELHILAQMLKENKKVEITRVQVSIETYKQIFCK